MSKTPTFRAYLAYVLAAAFLFYEMALQVSPSVMTHQLMRDLNVDASGLGVMASVYFYSYTIMQIPAGLLFDRFNSRILISSMLLFCALGALFFGDAQTVWLAAMGRFLMGIGSAFAFIGVLTVAARWFPLRYFALLVGVAQLLAAVGAMGGEAPLAAALNHLGWRHMIAYIGYAGIVLAVLIWIVIRHKTKEKDAKKLTVSESLRIVARNSQTWWVGLYAFLNWAPITAFAALWGVPFLMQKYDISSTLAAMACAMIWTGLAIASPAIGWLSDRIGRRISLLVVCATVGLLSSFIVVAVPHIPLALTFVLLFLFGMATSGQILSFAVVRDNNRPAVLSTAIGFNNMAVVAGGALFQPFVGFLLRWHWRGEMTHGVPLYSVSDYRLALLVVPACFLLGLLVSRFLISETFCQPRYTV